MTRGIPLASLSRIPFEWSACSSSPPAIDLRGTQIIPSRIPALVFKVSLRCPFGDNQARLFKRERMFAKTLHHAGMLFQGPVIGNKEVRDFGD